MDQSSIKLQQNIKEQLDRLLSQLKDLEELKEDNDFDKEEYE